MPPLQAGVRWYPENPLPDYREDEWLKRAVDSRLGDVLFWVKKGYKLTEKQAEQVREIYKLIDNTD